MTVDEYQEARGIAQTIADSLDLPLFYREKKEECALSRRMFEKEPLVEACVAMLKTRKASYGHGLSHACKVAVDAGAIIIVEGFDGAPGLTRLVFLAHIAGVLHDIARSNPDHAHVGAQEAGIILDGFNLPAAEIEAITGAIENHEAFQPCKPLNSRSSQLLSDALYDADKFRWGPDNFTEMIWDILAPRRVPVATLIERFLPGLKGIEKIRGTFRTETGKKYGPDFIDRGITIGLELYKRLGGTELYRR